jgi:hypothetical protein
VHIASTGFPGHLSGYRLSVKQRDKEAWKPEGEQQVHRSRAGHPAHRSTRKTSGPGFYYFRSGLARSFAHEASRDCGGIGRWRVQAAHVASSPNNVLPWGLLTPVTKANTKLQRFMPQRSFSSPGEVRNFTNGCSSLSFLGVFKATFLAVYLEAL